MNFPTNTRTHGVSGTPSYYHRDNFISALRARGWEKRSSLMLARALTGERRHSVVRKLPFRRDDTGNVEIYRRDAKDEGERAREGVPWGRLTASSSKG